VPKSRKLPRQPDATPATALTAKQDRFAVEYLKDCNATQAAIRAGYRKTGARVQGVRLLTNARVAEIIGTEQERMLSNARLDVDRLQQEAERMAVSDVRRLVRDGELLPIEDSPDNLAPACLGRSRTSVRRFSGSPVTESFCARPVAI